MDRIAFEIRKFSKKGRLCAERLEPADMKDAEIKLQEDI